MEQLKSDFNFLRISLRIFPRLVGPSVCPEERPTDERLDLISEQLHWIGSSVEKHPASAFSLQLIKCRWQHFPAELVSFFLRAVNPVMPAVGYVRHFFDHSARGGASFSAWGAGQMEGQLRAGTSWQVLPPPPHTLHGIVAEIIGTSRLDSEATVGLRVVAITGIRNPIFALRGIRTL